MKRFWALLPAVFVPSICAINAYAGTISYVGIPSTQSDSNCGISRDHGYTTAVDGGNSRETDRVINGITLYPLSGAGQNTATGDNCTLNALSGTLTDGGLTSKNIAADGTMRDVLSDMVFNNAGGDNSQIEIVLDPESLDEGATYDLRIYVCSSSGQNRQVNLQFFGDSQNGVETGFFNEDDARTSAGRFQNANQVYYINYRYTWDGDSTPGITITQKFGGAPFCLYALTNELVSEAETAAAGAATGGAQAGVEGEEAVEGEGLSSGFVQQESDEIGVESDDFYGSESLNAHGRWVKLEKWGTCWQPTDVSTGWAPYTNGSWKECDDCGWTFVSDEPWAWACYHYGRWAKVGIGCGWAWVPGTVWAPSWVSWRQGRDETSIGWAPLPPEAGCRFGVGISSWVDSTCNIGPEYYTFINVRDFGLDSYFGCGCIYDRARNVTIIIDTFNCTNIYYGRHVNIYCGGPDFNWCNTRIRQLGGKECGKIYVNRYDNPERLGGKFARREGEQLGLVSPRIHGSRNPKMRPKIAESAGADKIDHGWNGIKDKKQEQQVRRHIAQETRGKSPRNTKAKLPDGVAEKAAQHQRRHEQGTGQAHGGGALKPGGKGHRQAQGENIQGQGQSGGAGTTGDQHPGKHRRSGQGQAAAAGAAGAAAGAATQGSGFDQHPGKNKGRRQGGKGATGTTDVAGGTGAGGTPQTGGGRNPRHPGQSSGKKRGGQGAGTADTGAAPQGAGGTQTNNGATTDQGQAGGSGRKGKRRGNQQNADANPPGGGQQTQTQGAEGQGGQAAGGGRSGGGGGRKGRRRQRSQQQHQQQVPQGQGQGQTQTASQGGGGGNGTGGGGSQGKGKRRQQHTTQQGGGQGQSGGGGGQGHQHQQQLQQQQLQQQQQQRVQQQQAQQQQYQQQQHQQHQQGGGGGGRGKRGRPTPTPPPR